MNNYLYSFLKIITIFLIIIYECESIIQNTSFCGQKLLNFSGPRGTDIHIILFNEYALYHIQVHRLRSIIGEPLSTDYYDTVIELSDQYSDRISNTLFQRPSDLRWEEIPRINPALEFPTDFVLVRFGQNWKTHLISRLKSSSSIYSVSRQRLFSRKELSLSDENNLQDYKENVDNDINDNLPTSGGGFNYFLSRSLHDVKNNENDFDSNHGDRLLHGVSGKTKTFHNKPGRNHPPIGKSPVEKVSVATLLKAQQLWNEGYTGKGVKVAIFDTGLHENHPHFKKVKERSNWTNEPGNDDPVGHGTFVAGIIASQAPECPGFAPDVDLYIFRVFDSKHASFTSWFLDALNYAIQKKIDILNLSVGGPDYLDHAFVEKIRQLCAAGIVIVSAIGNDGPAYGTLNNPADMNCVIGVGGMNFNDRIASFSARGMTTWELPSGYGRVKPDVVTYAINIPGSRIHGGCRTLSGTSVACPVVTGALSLLASMIPVEKRSTHFTPASVRQCLIETTKILPRARIVEQGYGRLNLIGAAEMLREYRPKASFVPSRLDLTRCPYFWPYCTQPLYYNAQPTILNITVLNGLSVDGKLSDVQWKFHKISGSEGMSSNHDNDIGNNENNKYISSKTSPLKVEFSYQSRLYPWAGNLAIFLTVIRDVDVNTIVEGKISALVETCIDQTNSDDIEDDIDNQNDCVSQVISVILRVMIQPRPERWRILLWDQFHQMKYPEGFFPRDDLSQKDDPLDWHGDHPHTNFHALYSTLIQGGFVMEILGRDYTCFNASLYGTLLIVDPEDEFFPEEIDKLHNDIVKNGLSVFIAADWYNEDIIHRIAFTDARTKKKWIPFTGGANLPALNMLLEPIGISFGNHVYRGEASFGENLPTPIYASGTSITRFPKNGYLHHSMLQDITPGSRGKHNIPILGILPPKTRDFLDNDITDTHDHSNSPTLNKHLNEGMIAVYGDSNCLDSSHLPSDQNCYWMLIELLRIAAYNISDDFPSPLLTSDKYLVSEYQSTNIDSPLRMNPYLLPTISRVMGEDNVGPACSVRTHPVDYNIYNDSHSRHINTSSSSNVPFTAAFFFVSACALVLYMNFRRNKTNNNRNYISNMDNQELSSQNQKKYSDNSSEPLLDYTLGNARSRSHSHRHRLVSSP